MKKSSSYFRIPIYLLLLSFLFLVEDVARSERFVPKSDLIRSVIGFVQSRYVNPERIEPRKMLERALEETAQRIDPVVADWKNEADGFKVGMTVGSAKADMTFANLSNLNDLEYAMQKVARFIKKNIRSEDVKRRDIDNSLINGMLASLDPHSVMFTPEVYNSFSTENSGSFGGVGMYINVRDGQLTVSSPIKGTPAARAGLKSEDKIMQIDDTPTLNITMEEALKMLRGRVGTPVDIYVLREGFSAPRKFTVVREVIPIVSVVSAQYEKDGKRLLYLNLKRFNRTTFEELNDEIAESDYDLNDFKGFVMDLRNNPGGFLDQAIDVADKFLSEGVIVSTASYEKRSVTDYEAKNFNAIDDVPVVVLVNHASASASEIYAGAVKANRRGVLIGERTFGKGSVQSIYELRGGSALKLTTSQYLTPGRKSIQIVGVVPDVHLEMLTVSKDFAKIETTDFTFGEGSLSQSIVEWSGEREEAKAGLRYLYVEPEAVEKEFFNDVLEEELDQDFAFTVARDVLFDYEGNEDYETLLNNLLTHTEKLNGMEETELESALEEVGVDWSGSSSEETDDKRISMSHRIEVKEEGEWVPYEGALQASRLYRLHVDLMNESPQTLSRLYGLADSTNRRFANRQLVFGKIAPGGKASWYLPFELGKNVVDMDFTVEIEVFDESGKIDNRRFSLRQAASPKPRYRFSAVSKRREVATGFPGFDVAVTLENVGQADSGDLTIFLRNEEQRVVRLLEARADGVRLEIGEKRRFEFSLDTTEPPADGDIDLLLRVTDGTYFGSNFEQDLKIPFDSGDLELDNSPTEFEFGNLPLATRQDTVKVSGSIRDSDEIKNYYVFRNDKKILYRQIDEGGKRENSVDFDFEIDLEEGMNEVGIFTKDGENLSSGRILFIRKEPGELVANE